MGHRVLVNTSDHRLRSALASILEDGVAVGPAEVALEAAIRLAL